MVGVVRPSLSWCYLLRKIALSRVGGVVWPTWANLSSISRLITILQPNWCILHLYLVMELSLNFVDRDLFFSDINSRTHSSPPVFRSLVCVLTFYMHDVTFLLSVESRMKINRSRLN